MVTKDALFVVVGFLAGLLSGAFGVGGAVISTPLIRLLGVSPIFAVASTLPAVLPSAITGSIRYHQERLINWKLVTATAPIGVVAAIAGAYLSPRIPGRGHLQMILTAALLGYVALRLTKNVEAHATAKHVPKIGVPTIIGITAGSLSGLLGVGGGIVTFPAFRDWLRLPIRSAIATSLVCVGIFAIPSTITHAIGQNISWRVAIELAIGVVPGAAIGSHFSMKAKEHHLQQTIAVILGIIAVAYGVLEARALFIS